MIEFPQRRRIYLMRHGEAAYVSSDGEVTRDPRQVALTETGRQQADVQGDALADVEFDRVICSGLPRTVETAQRVLARNRYAAPDLERVPELEEIHGLGRERRWPSEAAEVRSLLQDIANPWAAGAQPQARFLGGELFSDFAARVVPRWQTLLTDSTWNTVLLVLHGAVNRLLLNHVTGLGWRAEVCFEQDNGNINIIDVDATDPPRYLIRAVNLTAYNFSKAGIVRTNMEDTALRMAELFSAR